MGSEEVLFVHVVPLFYLFPSGELKTKPIQHSVKELMRNGIAPDILMIRTQGELSDNIRDKISLFCNVSRDAVIHAPNCASIYQVPLVMEEQ